MVIPLLRKSAAPPGRPPVVDRVALIRAIRNSLDPVVVARSAVEGLQEAVGCARVTLWMADGSSRPRAIASSDGSHGDDLPSRLAFDAVRRRKPTSSDDGFAVPVTVGKQHGTLSFEGATPEAMRSLLVEVAVDVGRALEQAMAHASLSREAARAATILDEIGSGIIVTDPNGIIEDVRGAGAAPLAAEPSASGRPCHEVLQLRVGERVLSCSDGCPLLALEGASDPRGIQVWRPDEAGRRQPLLATVREMNDGSGSVVHTLRDVTLLKEAEEAKTMFLATASHELKTPLTVIQGFAQLLSTSRDEDDDRREEGLRAIERRAVELSKIVERILLSSRIESGRVEVNCEPIDLRSTVAERVEALRRSTGRDVSFADSGDDIPRVWADHGAVITVVDHLLDNAMKYSPDGGPIVVALDALPGEVMVSISDHGIGMASEDVAHCFDRFWQAESGDTRRFGGTGIGLYIVRSLIEAMDGHIKAESVLGEGTTFRVTLLQDGYQRSNDAPANETLQPERSVIREFMRQIGVPDGGNL